MNSRWALPLEALVATAVVAGLAYLVGHYSGPVNAGFKDGTAVVALASAVALGIERVIETVWTVVSFVGGGWWPMNIVRRQVDTMVDQLNGALTPVYDQSEVAIRRLQTAGTWNENEVQAALGELRGMRARVQELQRLAPDNQRAQLIGSAALQGINLLNQRYPEVDKGTKIATQAIAGLTDFVGTFKDNPARRLISLYLGVVIGLAVSGVLGLDLFQAVLLGSGTTAGTFALFGPGEPFHLGVAATGVVLGLGANPTHEVIRLLQEIKKSSATRTAPAGAPAFLAAEQQPAGGAKAIAPRYTTGHWKLTRD
jgi:hypothetical protein